MILAAGKGKRMRSDLPKVMFPIGGRPSLAHPLEAAKTLNPDRIVVVVGHGADLVKEAFSGSGAEFVLQEKQLGTGHAVLVTRAVLSGFEGALLVLYGDGPLITPATLDRLLALHREEANDATLLTCERPDPTDYGRVVRDSRGLFVGIVEERDCDEATRRTKEVYSGIAVYEAPAVFESLEKVGNDNAQKEYYLTDLPGLLMAEGRKIGTVLHEDPEEIEGFNSLDQYEAVRRAFEMRKGQKRDDLV